jgi:putative FmdB family regulatory protein
MPVYEYACEKCKHEFEAEQRISDEPIRTCPKCRARKVKRLISRTSFVLKGSGWYSDLYASPGAKKDGDSKGVEGGDKPTTSDAKSDSISETKSESKPDAKPAAKSDAKGDKAKSKSKAA